jgi:ppGpp synthetase/RelA/SpoT-type nucleotidyltranferase
MPDEEAAFDFQTHAQSAVAEYLPRLAYYRDLAAVVKRILDESTRRRLIKVHSIEGRPKDPESFGKKAAQPSPDDPSKPKYRDPLAEITDLAAVRVITFFPGTLDEVDSLIDDEFTVVERSDKGAELLEDDRFGYQSIHYLVKLSPERVALPEYAPFADSLLEVQVRTILQHAWAEIEHDIQYKTASVIPLGIRRRFMALAGMLEIADREFQAIQDADQKLMEDARERVKVGQLEDVEITPDALKTFLDEWLGPDGRITGFSYEWNARLLKRLGFRTLGQVAECIRGYDDAMLSRVVTGGRQGQTTRFEYMLLAGMGKRFMERHIWAREGWYRDACVRKLNRMAAANVDTKGYNPLSDGAGEPTVHQAVD